MFLDVVRRYAMFIAAIWTAVYTGASGGLQHAAVLMGHDTTFDCVTTVPDPQILWDHKSADRTHSSKLMDGLSVKDNRSGRVLVDHNRTDIIGSRLFIYNIQLLDAGTYSCINGHTGETQLTAELTVVAGVPSCYMNIASSKYIVEESENLLVTCNISSYGIIIPNVICDFDANQTRLVNAGFTSDNSSYSCYRWNVRATTAMQGSHVECRVRFEYQQETYYNNTWISPAISVAYGPHLVTIQPQNQTVFGSGDQLECTAEGNPRPHYHWTVGNVVENGHTMTVDVCKFVDTLGDTLSTRVLVKCIADRDTRTATTTKEIELTVSDTQRQLCAPSRRTIESSGTAKSTETPKSAVDSFTSAYIAGLLGLFWLTTTAVLVAILAYIKKSYGSRCHTSRAPGHQQPDLIAHPEDYRSTIHCPLELDVIGGYSEVVGSSDAVAGYSEVGGGSGVVAGRSHAISGYSEVAGSSDVIPVYSEVARSSAAPAHEFQRAGGQDVYAEVVPPSQRHVRTKDNGEKCSENQSEEKEDNNSVANLLYHL